MKKITSKGFTLIELLAVITIMGILMIVAIPAVTRTIENSRKDTFIDTVKQYVNGAKNMWAADNLSCHAEDGNYYVSSAVPSGTYYIEVDSSNSSKPQLLEQGGKSPWGSRDMKGYIQVVVEDINGFYGEMNGDNVIDSSDVMEIAKYFGYELISAKQIAADVNRDGEVNESDGDLILRKIAAIIDGGVLPVDTFGQFSFRNVSYYPVISDDVHGINLVKSGNDTTANTTLTVSDELKRGSITMNGMTYYTPSLTNICVES